MTTRRGLFRLFAGAAVAPMAAKAVPVPVIRPETTHGEPYSVGLRSHHGRGVVTYSLVSASPGIKIDRKTGEIWVE